RDLDALVEPRLGVGVLGQLDRLCGRVDGVRIDLFDGISISLAALHDWLPSPGVVDGRAAALPRNGSDVLVGPDIEVRFGLRDPQRSTVTPIERAVPSMMSIAALMSLALRSGSLVVAISRTWSRLILPT